MPRKIRRYSIAGTEEIVTSPQLRRLSRTKQLEIMRDWFNDNYDDPLELPYDSGEGGYQWIWGGPYDAEEALQDEFGGSIPDEVIEELASDLSDISTEWSGKPMPEDFDDDYLARLVASGTSPFITLLSSLEDIESAAKINAGEKERSTLRKLLFANVITALETFLGDLFLQSLAKSEKYLQDFVFKTPHFQSTQIKLSSIFERIKKIDAEIRSYVLTHNWHMLKESGMMYKRAFNITFPDIPPVIANGIRDRHDIVHRNGKGEDGTLRTWGLTEILALKRAVIDFAGNVDSQAKNLAQDGPVTAVANPVIDPDINEF